MEIINEEFSELMFDISSTQIKEIADTAFKKCKYKNAVSFLNKCYGFTIYLSKDISLIDSLIISSAEAISANEIKFKLDLSNHFTQDDLIEAAAHRKTKQQTISMIVKTEENEVNAKIEIDEKDFNSLEESFREIQKRKNVLFKKGELEIHIMKSSGITISLWKEI